MPLTLPSVLLISLTDPVFLAGAAVAVALVVYVIATLTRQPNTSTASGSGPAGSPDQVAQTKQQLQERAQEDPSEPSPTERPGLKPGKGRSLREMADHEEIDESSLLSRFIVNAQGETIGETVALEPDLVVLKKEGTFYAVSLDSIIEKDGMLLVDAKIDWDAAQEQGEEWRKQAYDEMEYDDQGMPVVEE